MRSIWKTFVELFAVLPYGAKRFYAWYSWLTSLLSVLDAAALALVLAAITAFVSSQAVALPLLGLLPADQVAWLVVVICALFVFKGVLAVVLHWVATRRFAHYEMQVGDELFQGYIRADWATRSELSTAVVTRLVDVSMANTNLGFILPLSRVPGSVVTFFVVFSMLVAAEPVTALIAFIYLSTISAAMILVVSRQTKIAGKRNRDLSFRVATIMTEMVDALKEVMLRGKLEEVGRVVSQQRQRVTRARANLSFLGIISAYALEVALIGGFLLVGGASYLMGGSAAAVVSVTLFGATGFRMIPAMNMIQSSISLAAANQVFARDVIRELRKARESAAAQPAQDTRRLPATMNCLQLKNVSFRYPGATRQVLHNLTLTIPFGRSLAIVGPSGSGKSTLIDMLLGLHEPTSGSVEIDGIALTEVRSQWRERVGYVPQRVALFDATIAQNIALTWENNYDEARVVAALRRAHLDELLEHDEGLLQMLGERGQSVSGGQQQRLGIARALYTNPAIMVMDEATSALDTETESRITASMKQLQDEVTFLTVAHRLTTIRDYDQICYLDQGTILGCGTFDEVVEQVPAFRVQAELAGLV